LELLPKCDIFIADFTLLLLTGIRKNQTHAPHK